MTLKKYCFEILNAIAKPILVIDKNYQIIAANHTAFNSFHSSSNDLIGRACYEITHRFKGPCWQDDTKCPVKEAYNSHKKATAIHRHKYDGTVMIEEIIAVPVFDDRGEILFIVEELNDITELVKSIEVIDHLRGEIKTLRDIVPICSSCRKIRDDKGYWQNVENYFRNRSDIEFTHGICPDCMRKLYPEYKKK